MVYWEMSVSKYTINININTFYHSATKCQIAYAESGSLIDGKYIPKCTETGEYEKMQCLYGNVGECWCVNEDGEELAGTRQKGKGRPDCEQGKKKSL